MGIPDRIILTLYTFLMAVVAVLVVLCSLGVIGQTAITTFFATIPGNWNTLSAVSSFYLSVSACLSPVSVQQV